MSLLTHIDAGGDAELLKANKRAFQTLSNDAEREAYKLFGLQRPRNYWRIRTDFKTFKMESFYFYIKTFK